MPLDFLNTAADEICSGCSNADTEDSHHYIRIKQQTFIEDILRMGTHLRRAVCLPLDGLEYQLT